MPASAHAESVYSRCPDRSCGRVAAGRPIPNKLQKDSGVHKGRRLSAAITSVTV